MNNELKICIKCNVEKSIEEFRIRNKKTGNRRTECKSCLIAYNTQHRLNNIESYTEKSRLYHEKNKERNNIRCIEYRKNNYEKVIQKEKDYYKNNKDQILERKKLYYQNNKDDPQFKIKRNLRTRMWSVFNQNVKTGSTIDDMGCSVEFLMDWFEFTFHNYKLKGENINWENSGSVWDIDHVIPLSKFNMDNKEEFLISAHWTNLFPLPKTLNRSKYNKIVVSSIKKQKYLLEKYLIMKNNNTSLKFLEYFKIKDKTTPADLSDLITSIDKIKI